jgi:Tfp pilus assembly protein PilF
MAERFLYWPSLGFCLLVGFYWVKWSSGRGAEFARAPLAFMSRERLFSFTFLIVAGLFSYLTVQRNKDWENSFTLLLADVDKAPNSARIRYALGSTYLIEKALPEEDETKKQDLIRKSISELEKGVTILPTYADAFYHLGLAYREDGQFQKAVTCFEKARGLRAYSDADFYIRSGVAYGKAGMLQNAIRDLQTAVSLNEKSADAHNNLGLYFTESGILDSAMLHLNRAIELDPKLYQAIFNLGNAYARAGRFTDAMERYRKALAVKPNYPEALNNLGNAYAASGDYLNAIVYFKQYLELRPNDQGVRRNIGVTYLMMGDTSSAKTYLK